MSDVRQQLIEVVAKALLQADLVWENLAPWEKEDARLDAAAVVDALGVEVAPATQWLKHWDAAKGRFVRYATPLYRIRALEHGDET